MSHILFPYETHIWKKELFIIEKINKIPIDSRSPGSSETLSSFDKNPRIVRNALSLTPLSESVVSEHRAGNILLATS